jgi:hypothetical protein
MYAVDPPSCLLLRYLDICFLTSLASSDFKPPFLYIKAFRFFADILFLELGYLSQYSFYYKLDEKGSILGRGKEFFV